MQLSPINYQMEIIQNNSINFQSRGNVIGQVQKVAPYIVRNKRTNYPKNKQPKFSEILNEFTRGFKKKEEVKYNKYGDIKTVYYDNNGNEMAIVYDVNSMGCYNHKTIHTKDKDFIDWNKTGFVDCYDEDRVIDMIPKLKQSLPKRDNVQRSFLDKVRASLGVTRSES